MVIAVRAGLVDDRCCPAADLCGLGCLAQLVSGQAHVFSVVVLAQVGNVDGMMITPTVQNKDINLEIFVLKQMI